MFKHLPPEERLYRIINKNLNVFKDANFNDEQLSFANNRELNKERFPTDPPDTSTSPIENRMLFNGYTYFDGSLERIKERIEELRDKFDLPFDEMYHK